MEGYTYDAKVFGKRLKQLRKNKQFTQETLAELLYLSVDSISNYETGKTTCMPEHLIKICQIFNVSADYFFFGELKPLHKEDCSDRDEILLLLDGCSKFNLLRINRMIQILLLEDNS